MYWPIVAFSLGILFVTVFLAAAGFHVFRYRYRNDASMAVFALSCVLFFFVTIFIYAEFDWGSAQPPVIPLNLDSL